MRGGGASEPFYLPKYFIQFYNVIRFGPMSLSDSSERQLDLDFRSKFQNKCVVKKISDLCVNGYLSAEDLTRKKAQTY